MPRNDRKKRRSPAEGRGADSQEDPDRDMRSRSVNRLGAKGAKPGKRTSNVLRSQKIQRIKDEIRRDVYETDEKLNIAIDRLIEDVLRNLHK
jgi:anti-sigma28 factor (negative regulator of flagellin synthesis)